MWLSSDQFRYSGSMSFSLQQLWSMFAGLVRKLVTCSVLWRHMHLKSDLSLGGSRAKFGCVRAKFGRIRAELGFERDVQHFLKRRSRTLRSAASPPDVFRTPTSASSHGSFRVAESIPFSMFTKGLDAIPMLRSGPCAPQSVREVAATVPLVPARTRKSPIPLSMCVRVVLAQGPCSSSLYRYTVATAGGTSSRPNPSRAVPNPAGTCSADFPSDFRAPDIRPSILVLRSRPTTTHQSMRRSEPRRSSARQCPELHEASDKAPRPTTQVDAKTCGDRLETSTRELGELVDR